MDKNRVEGVMDKATGAVKKAAGDVTGDRKLQAEGMMDKAKGEIKNVAGGIKDAMKSDDDCGCGNKH